VIGVFGIADKVRIYAPPADGYDALPADGRSWRRWY